MFSNLPLCLHLSLFSHSVFSCPSLPLSPPFPLWGTSPHRGPWPSSLCYSARPSSCPGEESSQCQRPCCPRTVRPAPQHPLSMPGIPLQPLPPSLPGLEVCLETRHPHPHPQLRRQAEKRAGLPDITRQSGRQSGTRTRGPTSHSTALETLPTAAHPQGWTPSRFQRPVCCVGDGSVGQCHCERASLAGA